MGRPVKKKTDRGLGMGLGPGPGKKTQGGPQIREARPRGPGDPARKRGGPHPLAQFPDPVADRCHGGRGAGLPGRFSDRDAPGDRDRCLSIQQAPGPGAGDPQKMERET